MESSRPLDAIFREVLGDNAAGRALPSAGALREMWNAGKTAWPDVALDAETFVRGLAARANLDTEGRADAPPLGQAPDVYLAVACANGIEPALAAFDRVYAPDIAATASRIDPSPAFKDEVVQVVRQHLFLVTEERGAKIAEYGGLAPLRSWVRVVAKRMALNLQRATAREEPEDASKDIAVAEGAAPELEYMRALYKEHFEVAIRRAFAALTSRDRTLLRLSLAERMTLAQIGVVYDVSHATIARWLGTARDALITEMRRALSERLTLSPSEYESVVALVRSQLDVQVLDLLRSKEASRGG